MLPIIIGAGRGRRLKEMTDDMPKCLVPIRGKRILDWILQALQGARLGNPVFIGGYLIEVLKQHYPDFVYCHNDNWANNNILASLFYAEEHMADGFVCTYSDIVYKAAVVQKALDHPGDIVLCVDTDWRTRYLGRTEHPESDGETLIFEGDRVVKVHRDIPADQASGEYIGVAKFTPRGAAQLKEVYHDVLSKFAGKPWREAVVFEKAYKILIFQEMIERDIPFHMVPTHGDYIEIDTQQDYAWANEHWKD